MPLPRILLSLIGASAGLLVLARLAGLTGWAPGAAGALALLATAALVVLRVSRPVARWALAGGILLLAALPVLPSLLIEGTVPIGRSLQQQKEAGHTGTILLLVAVLALTVGVTALPRSPRPFRPAVAAGVVALLPLGYLATEVAGVRGRSLLDDDVPVAALGFLAPGLAATVLAGLAVVLAASRAGRWLLLPAGLLLVQATTAHWTAEAATTWSLAELYGDPGDESAFLNPGMVIDTAYTSTATLTLDPGSGAVLPAVALLLGAALIAAGAGHPAGDRPEPARAA